MSREWLASELRYTLTAPVRGSVQDQFDPHRHGIGHITNQFEHVLLDAVLHEELEEAATALLELPTSTIGEELVLHQLKVDERLKQVRRDLQAHVARVDVRKEVEESKERIRFNDKYQFDRDKKRRPLHACIRDGVLVRVPAEMKRPLRDLIESLPDGPVPILEQLKNERFLEASGFMANKASLAIHDALDHVWLFHLIDSVELFDKYSRLWEGIGDPRKTDIFKREGECVASIGFGTRYWANIDAGFIPLVTVHQIAEHMGALFDCGGLASHHLEAFRIVRWLVRNAASREAQSLGFVFSNYLVELDEQRRKHGTIKFCEGGTGEVLGELNPWSADFLSFFIEAHHLLNESRFKHRYTTFRVNHLVEEYFYSGKATAGQELKIDVAKHFYWEKPQSDRNGVECTVPIERIHWMANSPGFTAIRDTRRW